VVWKSQVMRKVREISRIRLIVRNMGLDPLCGGRRYKSRPVGGSFPLARRKDPMIGWEIIDNN